jgi:hypothetical protein
LVLVLVCQELCGGGTKTKTKTRTKGWKQKHGSSGC